VNGTEDVPLDHFALFTNHGETFSIKATEDSVVLIISGDPLKEPIEAHGPFVMNSRAEILQAFEDYENGKFGVLED
jgi:redox-sensitive bicupin YhaK (pirin superfamily)